MSICKRITRSLGTLIILWSAAACAAQSLEITDVSGASDAGAGSNGGAAVSTTETGPAPQGAAPDPGVGTAPASEPGAEVSSDAPAPAKGLSEGVKVHGHWSIEVKQPDGTLVSRREFDNAFVPPGSKALSEALGRVKTPGRWQILVGSDPTNEICEAPIGTANQGCLISETGEPITAPNIFKTLIVAVVGTPATLKLSGSLTAARDGVINVVQTSLLFCANTVSPDACKDVTATITGDEGITEQILAPAIAVLSGQQVQVRVVLSFS